MTTHVLARRQVISAPLPVVFDFFSRAENLEALTPAFLRFRILTPLPITMRLGTGIEYKLRLSGVPIHWRTRITAWEPGVRFVDEQEKGPYKLWRHTHEFEANGDWTVMRDRVDYELPLGVLGSMAHGIYVKRTLQRIFDYRGQQVERLLGGAKSSSIAPCSASP